MAMNETTIAKRVKCPVCENKGKRVSSVTLAALLTDEFAQQFTLEDNSCGSSDGEGCSSINADTGWRFCDSKKCEVVYFSEEDDEVFGKSQLKVSVGVKETIGERPLCYCFGHSVASIKQEFAQTGQSNAQETIRANMKDLGCRCETENPSGACGLGSVVRGIETARKELEATSTTPDILAESSSYKGERIAKIGTVVSAIMASACCWLPLVLLAIGVSGAGIAATLEEFRPLFMVVTFGFLAAAFYFTYRPKKPAVAGGQDCCATNTADADGCRNPAKGRFNMMTMNKVMLWGVTVLAVAFLFFPSYVGVLLGTGETPVSANMQQIEFEIQGMTCEGCATIAEQAIRQSPGVIAVEVNYEKGTAVVGVEQNDSHLVQSVVSKLKAAGYDAKPFD